jgi:DNA-binding response OmpR family regulator
VTRKRLRVLVVDDNEELLKGIVSGLSQYDFKAIGAKTADNAIVLCREEQIDVAIIDVVLEEGLSGPELIKLLRKSAPLMPIVAISGVENVRDCRACFKAGAQDYVAKPISIGDLAQRVRETFVQHSSFTESKSQKAAPLSEELESYDELALENVFYHRCAVRAKPFLKAMEKLQFISASRACNGEPKRIATMLGVSLGKVYQHIREMKKD